MTESTEGPEHRALVTPDLWREALRRTSLLSVIPSDLFGDVISHATERRFVRDDYICRDGDFSNCMYLIVQGEVDIVKLSRNHEVVLARLGAGEPFGEMALIDDSPRSASARVATDEVVVMELERDHVLGLLHEHPQVLYAMVKLLNSRLRTSDFVRVHDLERQVDEMAEATRRLQRSYDDTLMALSQALDLRDQGTSGHLQRVTAYTLLIADTIGVGAQDREALRLGSLLHDIGKIGVSDAILHKKGKLTEEEWEQMRNHPIWGRRIIDNVEFLSRAAELVVCHHERWDGTGYPNRLRGTEIPLTARIFSVADVFDALTTERPYKGAWTPDAARLQIMQESGTHFDPAIVAAFLEVYEDLLDVMYHLPGQS